MNKINCCVFCNHNPVSIHFSGHIMTFFGQVQIYENNNDIYIKDCCLINYLMGGKSNNYFVYEQEKLIEEKYDKPKKFKILCVDGNEFKVFKFKPNACTNIKGFVRNQNILSRFNRSNISLIQYNGSYEILTETELKKKKSKKELIISSSLDYQISDELNTYIYMLKDARAVIGNMNVFKIGKTTQENFERFKGYPKGFKIYLFLACTNCHIFEKQILSKFRSKYASWLDFDTESFEGDPCSMIRDIFDIIKV